MFKMNEKYLHTSFLSIFLFQNKTYLSTFLTRMEIFDLIFKPIRTWAHVTSTKLYGTNLDLEKFRLHWNKSIMFYELNARNCK
jgi:hypothetical protein